MKIKSILFLSTIAILSLTSCSQAGYFEGFRHEVDKDEFSTLVNDINNVNRKDEEDNLSDFALTIYSYTENTQTTLYKNGNRRKTYSSEEESADAEYDADKDVYHVKSSRNTMMEVDSGSAKLIEKVDKTFQNTDDKLYSYDNIVKTAELESNIILCKDYVLNVFTEFLSEASALSQTIMRYTETENVEIVYYKDKDLYTQTLKNTMKTDDKTETIRSKVQFMFTKKRCFIYVESIAESVLENENQKISYKNYEYKKIEYNFRNFSIKPVNVNKYN